MIKRDRLESDCKETKHYSSRKRAPVARKLFEDEGTDDKKYRKLSRFGKY
jgi:hypothetical protein